MDGGVECARAKMPRGALEARLGLLWRAWAVGVCGLVTLLGCQKTYYTMLETVGIEKRELLATRVNRAKESQREAQAEFRDALEKFQAVTGSHGGGTLEQDYEGLRAAYEQSEEQAHDVSERIDAVENVADALLEEWEGELDRYQDRSLRRQSEERLRTTRNEVERLLRVMHKAERSLDPVLQKLEDRVLYLKHNLNAASVAGLDSRMPELQRDVDRLVREMEASIAEADRFIAQLN
jgi:flagellar motility protein MotE (MotC chaperone)